MADIKLLFPCDYQVQVTAAVTTDCETQSDAVEEQSLLLSYLFARNAFVEKQILTSDTIKKFQNEGIELRNFDTKESLDIRL